MWLLVLGLVLFLGVHSIRIVAADWRQARIAAMGENAWKGVYSVVSLISLVMIVYGYGMAREGASQLYDTQLWSRPFSHFAVPLGLTLVMASNFPAGHIKRIFKHPMLWGAILWAAAHLTSNGDTASVVLFGSFLVWAVVDLASCYGREQEIVTQPAVWADVLGIVLGIGLTLLFILWAHEWLFGVAVL